MVPKVFEPLKIYCILVQTKQCCYFSSHNDIFQIWVRLYAFYTFGSNTCSIKSLFNFITSFILFIFLFVASSCPSDTIFFHIACIFMYNLYNNLHYLHILDCMYVCMCACMCVCVRMRACVYQCMYLHVRIYMYVCMYAGVVGWCEGAG